MDGSYSHVYTYGMLALFLWLVERHEEEEHTKFKVLGGICFGLVTLIRVTNVVVIFVYLRIGSLPGRAFGSGWQRYCGRRVSFRF